jgi:hypothetical protein
MLRKWIRIVLSVFLAVFLAVILLVVLLAVWVVMFIFDVPRKVGQHLQIERAIRKAVFSILDKEEMRQLRDDILHILEAEVEKDETLDRWGLLRQIDESQEKLESRLKNGEFVFTFFGGIAALIVGNVAGIAIGGVVLTVFGLIVALLVAVRIIITDALFYRSVNHRTDPIERLQILKGWNSGPALATGAIGVAIVSLITSPDDEGFRWGQNILEWYVENKFTGEDKWRTE